jgi:hypothetical protein
LKFDSKPNILYLRGLFRELYKSKGYGLNAKGRLEWDWSKTEVEEDLPVARNQFQCNNTQSSQPAREFVTSLTVQARGLDGTTSPYEVTQRATVGTPTRSSIIGAFLNEDIGHDTSFHLPRPVQHLYTNSLPGHCTPSRPNYFRSTKSTAENGLRPSELPLAPPSISGYRTGIATESPIFREQNANSSHRNPIPWTKWGIRLKPKSFREFFWVGRNKDSTKKDEKSPPGMDSGLCTTNHNQLCAQSSKASKEEKTDDQVDANWNSNSGVHQNPNGLAVHTPGMLSVSSKFKSRWWSREHSNLSEVRNSGSDLPIVYRTSNTEADKRLSKKIQFKSIKLISRKNLRRAVTESNIVN